MTVLIMGFFGLHTMETQKHGGKEVTNLYLVNRKLSEFVDEFLKHLVDRSSTARADFFFF